MTETQTALSAFEATHRTSAVRHVARRTRSCLACILSAAFLATPAALASPSGSNQDMPGLADTPAGLDTAESKALADVKFQTENGRAILDSAILLKTYYYAYAGVPVDYSAVLTPDTDNIVPPAPVKASAADKAAIDRLVKDAKAHPDILLKVEDIALNAYDKSARSFEVVNRLFIDGGRFYFDNSPFHYVFSNPAPYRRLPCTDSRTIATINTAVENYRHFSMDIAAHFAQSDRTGKFLTFELQKITLKDEIGTPLITLTKP